MDINQYIKANRFVRCENCDHMFTVVGENDANKGRNSKVIGVTHTHTMWKLLREITIPQCGNCGKSRNLL